MSITSDGEKSASDPLLIDAKFLEPVQEIPPPRKTWYMILYVTRGGHWTLFRETASTNPPGYTTEEKAREVAVKNRLRHARIHVIPGEGE